MTLDVFSKVVSQADARGEFLSTEQLDALTAVVASGNKRLDAVNRITSNASAIVTNAARSLFAEQPNLIAPGGNAYTNRRMAACLRDMEIILRYVTYAAIAGDTVRIVNDTDCCFFHFANTNCYGTTRSTQSLVCFAQTI